MASYRIYNAKLASLRSMRRVTKTMQMVSATKLRKAQAAEQKAAQFTERLQTAAAQFLGAVDVQAHPLMQHRAPLRNGLLLVLSSDKGLCGGFNSNLIRRVGQWLDENRPRFHLVRASFCGRRAFSALKGQVEVRNLFDDIVARPTFQAARRLGLELIDSFMAGHYDRVYMAYNAFINAAAQEPRVVRLLPVADDILPRNASPTAASYLFDPGAADMLDLFLRKMICYSIYTALLNNAAGEHGARMTAMDSATTNVDNLAVRYTKLRNQARQSSITGELIEIISGAEALK